MNLDKRVQTLTTIILEPAKPYEMLREDKVPVSRVALPPRREIINA
jgi:hypothetical protein